MHKTLFQKEKSKWQEGGLGECYFVGLALMVTIMVTKAES